MPGPPFAPTNLDFALGSEYAGLFSNDDTLSERLHRAGEETGERRVGGGVEHVNLLVRRVHHPHLLLVGSQPDAVARAAVPFDRTFLEPRDLHAMQPLL